MPRKSSLAVTEAKAAAAEQPTVSASIVSMQVTQKETPMTLSNNTPVVSTPISVEPVSRDDMELTGIVDAPVEESPEETQLTEVAQTRRGVLFFDNSRHPEYCGGLVLPYRIVLNDHFAGEPKGNIYLNTAKRLTAGQVAHNARIDAILKADDKMVRNSVSAASKIWSQWQFAKIFMYGVANLKTGALKFEDGIFSYKNGPMIVPAAKISLDKMPSSIVGTYRIQGLPTGNAVVYNAEPLQEGYEWVTLRPTVPGLTTSYQWGGVVEGNQAIVWNMLVGYLNGCSVTIDKLASSCFFDPTKARQDDYKFVADNRLYFKAGMSSYLKEIFTLAESDPEAARLTVATHKAAARQMNVVNAHARDEQKLVSMGYLPQMEGLALELLPLPQTILDKMFAGHSDCLVEENNKKFFLLDGAAVKLTAYDRRSNLPVSRFSGISYDPKSGEAANLNNAATIHAAANSYVWTVKFC